MNFPRALARNETALSRIFYDDNRYDKRALQYYTSNIDFNINFKCKNKEVTGCK